MLDVHAPHETIRGWKSFFIHIATITIGLLIAIGLEQTVVHIHHLRQLDESRRELKTEAGQNRRQLDTNRAAMQQLSAQLDENMATLRAAQASHAAVGRNLKYEPRYAWPLDGSWQVARQNGSLGLMPHEEIRHYTYVYEGIAVLMVEMTELAVKMRVANAIFERAPDGKFTPRDLEELISATSELQARAALVLEILHYEDYGLKAAGS